MLTDEQLRTLARFKIPAGAVLDARGMQTSVWKVALKLQNKAVAMVDSPCGRDHRSRLRLSSGHCVECSPQGVAYWKRHQQAAFVYIAVSPKLGLIKVGIAGTASERADALIRDGYGGSDDWQLTYRRKFDKAGWVESKAQKSLAQYCSPRTYIRKGHGTSVTAKELFKCDYNRTVEAVEALYEHALGERWEPCELPRILARLQTAWPAFR